MNGKINRGSIKEIIQETSPSTQLPPLQRIVHAQICGTQKATPPPPHANGHTITIRRWNTPMQLRKSASQSLIHIPMERQINISPRACMRTNKFDPCILGEEGKKFFYTIVQCCERAIGQQPSGSVVLQKYNLAAINMEMNE